ncbi:MAG: LysR family transcriptional regulator [Pseudomonadota bacterium]
MDLKDLQVVISVAQLGSFAAAARARFVDPSVVSRIVSSVEGELGVRLFHRTTRTLNVTSAGLRYIQRIEPLIADMALAADDLTTETETVRGKVRMSAPVSIGRALVVPRLNALRNAHPELSLECVFSDQVTDLVSEGLDLAIRMAPSVSGDLVCTKLRQTRYRVVASRDWVQAKDLITLPEDLTQHDCVLFSLPGFSERWMFRDRDNKIQEVPVSGTFSFSNGDSVVDAMLSGLGPALLTDVLIEKHLAEGRCLDLFPYHQVAATAFDTAAWIVFPSRHYLPRKTRAVIDFLKTEIS